MTTDTTSTVALNRAGASTTTLKTVGDREKTAQRLLRSTADRSYDGELDIDWDAPLASDKKWISDYRQTLYGTGLWGKLSEEQRYTLGKHEIAAIFSYGIFAEVMLSTNLLRGVLESDQLVDDHCRYSLAEIAEETRHSTMFSRLLNLMDVEPYRQPKFMTKLVRIAGLIPRGPSMIGGTLLIEELLDRLQREQMNDPDLQPHVRQVMKIHVLEEARHITFAREELVRAMRVRGRASMAYHRGAFATQCLLAMPLLMSPLVYRSVGIHPARGLFAALRGPHYRDHLVFLSEPLMRYMYEVGMVQGPITTRIYKLARCLPDDILEDIERKKRAA